MTSPGPPAVQPSPKRRRWRWIGLMVLVFGAVLVSIPFGMHARSVRAFLPETLEELRPRYLSTLPIDPFGKGEIFRYRRESSPVGFVVWSVDEDGRDGGAKVGEFGFSKGDIVVRCQVPQAQK